MGVERMGDALAAGESPVNVGDRSKAAIDKMEPILNDFIKQVKQWDLAKREGVIPKEICAECSHKDWMPVPFSGEELEKIEKFSKLLDQEGIFSIEMPAPLSRATVGIRNSIAIKSKRQVIEIEREFTDVFATPERFLKKAMVKKIADRFRKGAMVKELASFLQKFGKIECCPHLKPSEIKVPDFVQFAGVPLYDRVLGIYCEECRRLTEKRGCKPDTYSHYCNIDEAYHKLNHVLLRKLLTANNLQFEEAKGYSSETNYWIPAHAVLITDSPEPYRSGIEERKLRGILREFERLVVSLSPALVVCFSKLWGVIWKTCYKSKKDVLIADLERGEIYLERFSKYPPCEKSVERVVQSVTEKLEAYAEQATESLPAQTAGGKESRRHKGIRLALTTIGEELGYRPDMPERKASEVDQVWLDEKENVAVAIEVEHTGDWHKDILSLWGEKPSLLAMLVTTSYLTDSVARRLENHAAMKDFPIKLLYLNMTTKNGYLFEKQEIIEKFPFGRQALRESGAIPEIGKVEGIKAGVS